MKKTQSQFIDECTSIHGDKYDYSNAIYTGSKELVSITCKIHGEFKQSANAHLAGKGCNICGVIARGKSCRKSKEYYIDKSNEVHNNKYDYSTVPSDITSVTKVPIICKLHGIFNQKFIHHIGLKHGCPSCALLVIGDKSRIKNFNELASKAHNGKYVYSLVNYSIGSDKIAIICPIHGNFTQIASAHLRGRGCPKCGIDLIKKNVLKYSDEEFIKTCNETHNNMYNYKNLKYNGVKSKIKIICKIHGEFERTAEQHLNGYGCKKCDIENLVPHCKYNTENFIIKANIIHKFKYDYSLVDYKNYNQKVQIICNTHGIFWQTPSGHLVGKGCAKCGKTESAESIELKETQFIGRASVIHKNIYTYEDFDYTNARKYSFITCKRHGNFKCSPDNHLRGKGCPKCSRRISKPSIEWLASLNNQNIIPEYTLPENYRRKVDGYDPTTNTVYQFHGTFYHCEPRVYPADKYDKMRKKPCGDVYKISCDRDEQIRGYGYNLVIMWEYDWNILIKCKELTTK